jgi:Ca-activated chloride channel homolog
MADRIHRHFQRMYAPRAVKAGVRWPVVPTSILPEVLDTVFDGDTVHVFAWSAEKPDGKVVFTAALSNGDAITHAADVVTFAADDSAAQEAPSTLARLAAARRLAGALGSRAAANLALRYQLMSPWTNYLVVHVRADGEKATDLPALRKVPQVTAAGWHGMGSVMADLAGVAPSRKMSYDYNNSARARRAEDRLERLQSLPMDEPSFYSSGTQFAPDKELTAADLAGILNTRSHSPLPSIDELECWGTPAVIVEVLRALINEDEAEKAVVAAFLLQFAHRDAGRALDRQVRRAIIKHAKGYELGVVQSERVVEALKRCGWASRSATAKA